MDWNVMEELGERVNATCRCPDADHHQKITIADVARRRFKLIGGFIHHPALIGSVV
jgi:hypothetical protein